jgi:hypothetical protein
MKKTITALMLAIVFATGASAAFAKPMSHQTQAATYASREGMVEETGN